MLKKSIARQIKNQKGMAIFEALPIMIIIVLLVNFSLGFFGAIHTGILNSIASRNYAFETFRNRTDLTYLRDNTETKFKKAGVRIHGTITDKSPGTDEWKATSRQIAFANIDDKTVDITGNDKATHTKTRNMPTGRNSTIGVNPIWIKTTYGICLNPQCGT